MPTTHRLRTVVQLSDLHIDSIESVAGDALDSRPAAQLAAQFSWGDGVLGHDGRVLQDVKAFDSGLVGDGEDRSRIVSGDVTRCGDGVDLATANGFLASQPNLHLVFRSTCLACRTFGSLMVACSSWLASIPTIDRGTGAVFDEVLVARDIQLILSGHAHDSSTTRVISRGHHAQTILGCRYDTVTHYDHIPCAW